MYYCMSKARRIACRCPPTLRVTLFKAHVSPLFTYACEVMPHSRKQIESMNKFVNKYARWSTGLPQRACTNAVLREAGLRPVQYDFLHARLNYFLLLISRDKSHITRLALADIERRKSTSTYSRWHCGITDAFEKLSCEQLLNGTIPADCCKRIIKNRINTLWLTEGGASMQDIEQQEKFTLHLRGINSNDRRLDSTYTVRDSVMASPASRVALRTQVTDMLKYGGRGRHHLSSTHIRRFEQEALSLFRTGVAPSFIHCQTGLSEVLDNRLLRVCSYCQHMHGKLFINDIFHVLFICPLVASERVVMWSALGHKCGAYEWKAAKRLCDLAYSLLCPQSVDVACIIGRFLSEFLAASEMFRVAKSGSPLDSCSPRWLGNKLDATSRMRARVISSLQSRVHRELPFPSCLHTHTWLAILAQEPLEGAFKPVRTWLSPGWALKIEKNKKNTGKSIALF